MKGIVAVAEGLSDIREALEENGYQVVDLNRGLIDADLVLISGLDRNMSGIDLRVVDVPVVDVTGRTPAEVLEDVKGRLNA